MKKSDGFWKPFFGFLGRPHVLLTLILGILVALGILNSGEIIEIIQAIGDTVRGR